MPAPSNPPPADEAGALLSPRQLNRWLDINPVRKLSRTQTYLTVPVFDIDYAWMGYSTLVAAFNATGDRNFTLPTITVPASPNYLLCISWIDSDNNMHRYKLWEDVGEVFFFDVPLYAGQLIKKNFRFEVWSVAPETITTLTLSGAGVAYCDGDYPISGVNEYTNENGLAIISIYDNLYWRCYDSDEAAPGTATNYKNNTTSTIFGLWSVVSTGPLPLITTSGNAAQGSSLTIYTSVRGNYDYMYQTDNVLTALSAAITNFNIADTDAPWTAPANSVSTINT